MDLIDHFYHDHAFFAGGGSPNFQLLVYLIKQVQRQVLGGVFFKKLSSIGGRLKTVVLLCRLSEGGPCGRKIGDRVGAPS